MDKLYQWKAFYKEDIYEIVKIKDCIVVYRKGDIWTPLLIEDRIRETRLTEEEKNNMIELLRSRVFDSLKRDIVWKNQDIDHIKEEFYDHILQTAAFKRMYNRSCYAQIIEYWRQQAVNSAKKCLKNQVLDEFNKLSEIYPPDVAAFRACYKLDIELQVVQQLPFNYDYSVIKNKPEFLALINKNI